MNIVIYLGELKLENKALKLVIEPLTTQLDEKNSFPSPRMRKHSYSAVSFNLVKQ